MTINSNSSESLVTQAIARFWETVPPAWCKIRGNVRGIAMEYFNLTVEQFHILRLIRKGCHSVSDLAAVQQISRSAISQSIDTLVAKGLVTRCEQIKDRRYVHLDLTGQGNSMLDAIFEKNRSWMLDIMSSLSEEELVLLLQGMEILKKTFNQPDNQQ
jgi:DNA-binding MarR family transcriptional regulator